MHNSAEHQKSELRFGFSTGACMTALACGLWHFAQYGIVPEETEVVFLDGVKKNLPLLTQNMDKGLLQIRKDGGDDPDCTHLAVLSARFYESKTENAKKEDYILQIGNDTLILHAMHGIGLCTRKGLDCEEGKWAVNSHPRQMLIDNLLLRNMGQSGKSRVWQLDIGVENGEELAKKTLNPKLGIVGGISVLGTTGHVKPFSHDAYIETIKICTRTAKLEGQKHIVYGTGARSLKSAKKFYPEFAESVFIPIADFIGKSIEAAKEAQIKEISIACMAGKLCKYADRQYYTHAHKEEQDLTALKEEIRKLDSGKILDSAWQNARSAREAFCSLSREGQLLVLDTLCGKALDFFLSLYGEACFHILLCDFEGNILTVRHGGNCNG